MEPKPVGPSGWVEAIQIIVGRPGEMRSQDLPWLPTRPLP